MIVEMMLNFKRMTHFLKKMNKIKIKMKKEVVWIILNRINLKANKFL